MTEPSPSDTLYSKIQPPSLVEVQKRKKSSKKKSEPTTKPSNPRTEPVEGVIPDLNNEAEFDLIHYTYKLEQQLAKVKKQLKQQRKNFRHVIHGLSKYFDAKGINPQAVDEYIKTLGTQISDSQDREAEYDKFFAAHKYQIVEDPASYGAKTAQQKPIQKPENAPKTLSKNLPSTTVKTDSLSAEQQQHIQIPDLIIEKPEKPEKNEKAEKLEKKKGRPPGKTDNSNGTEEAPKKRKYTKHKQNEEAMHAGLGLDVQEIPPFSPAKEFPKKLDTKMKKAEDIRGYEDISQKPIDLSMLGQAKFGLEDGLKALMKQMGGDFASIMSVMNPYMAAAGGFGMDGELSQKIYQELMRGNGPNPALNTEKARQELYNYYQTTYNK